MEGTTQERTNSFTVGEGGEREGGRKRAEGERGGREIADQAKGDGSTGQNESL